jgi:peptide-methionine (S)-S-oxide reductase
VSLKQLLGVFFGTHDPTTLKRQGNDAGTQYRSGIYVANEEQAQVSRLLIAEMTEEQIFPSPIVTEVLALQSFWPAEDYHQDYFERNPGQGYCAFVVAPKVAKLRKSFASLLR